MEQQVLLQLCQRLRLLFAAVEQAQPDALQVRLARQLLSLGCSYGQQESGKPRISLRLSQGDLAQLLAASRRRITACLRQLKRSGMLRMERGELSVLRPDLLKQMAE